MKLLIVDDESIVRVGIKSIVQNAMLNFETIEEAADGMVALEITRRILPDIILVDIRMPVMDGITFIKEARSLIPASKFIILSCLNEFELVKSALKLGVSDYIIKTTIDSDELIHVLEKALNEILSTRVSNSQTELEHTQNRMNKPLVIQACLNKLLDGCHQPASVLEDVFKDIGLPYNASGYVLAVGVFEKKASNPVISANEMELLNLAITNICQDIYNRYCCGYTFSRDGGYIVSLMTPDPSLRSDLDVDSFLREVITSANEYLGESLSFGISSQGFDFTHFHTAYEESLSALQNRFYSGRGSINHYPVLYREALLADPAKAKEQGLAVVKALLTLNLDELDQAIDRVYEYLSKEPHFNILEVKSFFCKIVFDLFEQIKDMGISVSSHEFQTEKILNEIMGSISFTDLLAGFRTFSCKFLEAAREYGNNHFTQLIQGIKTYVKDNLDKEITLASTADFLKINPSYVGKIFKIKTGESFSDYIHKEKVNLARALIQKNEKMHIIAEKLGYADIASFSRAFKNIQGLSPQQYKSLIRGTTVKTVK